VSALTVVFAVLVHFPGTGKPGRPREPEIVPDPRLRYGQVVKHRKGRRLVSVIRRVIFGAGELIPLKQISTSLLERLNGTIRQHVVPMHRKTRSFAKRQITFNLLRFATKPYVNNTYDEEN
jgi:hypothetical protein